MKTWSAAISAAAALSFPTSSSGVPSFRISATARPWRVSISAPHPPIPAPASMAHAGSMRPMPPFTMPRRDRKSSIIIRMNAELSRWELAAENIALKIRWFGILFGYLLVNLGGAEAHRDILNAILVLGVGYAICDTAYR